MSTYHRAAFTGVIITMSLAACAPVTSGTRKDHHVTAAMRQAAIRRAHVWAATDVASMDLRAGPQGPGAFAPNETVSCDYVDKKMTGRSPKFTCVKDPKDELKVKYGRNNGEVYAEVAASRLLWALGFVADRMYPVRIVCRGCPPEIERQGTDIASIQRKAVGREIDTREMSGWAWPELDQVDPRSGGAPRAQRDALKLLAVLLQHTDSKPEQQRLLCLGPREKDEDVEGCARPVMMVHDLGLTFGHANLFNRVDLASANLQAWSSAAVWTASAGTCIGNIPKSQTGTLDNPIIGEEGRKFLSDLLMQLTDAQLRDLFEVSRFARRSAPTAASPDTSSVSGWVDAFKKKRAEIANRVCS
jgi:hypothetical protein